jgi:hypothetical protein
LWISPAVTTEKESKLGSHNLREPDGGLLGNTKSRTKLGRCLEARRMKKSRNIGQARTWPSRGSWGVFVAYIKDDDAEKVDPLLQSESMYGVFEGFRRDLPCR